MTPRVLTVQLTDAGGAATPVLRRTVGVTSVNDIPNISLPTTSAHYNENGAPTFLYTGATVVDLDLLNTTSTRATLTVTNTNAQSSDRLQVIPSGVYTITDGR